jgi:O-antigen/teichoic acid export membrane protein
LASFLSRGVALLTSLITVPLTLKYLGAERYGLWMILTSIVSVMGFADLGIGNGLVNAISEADGKDDRPLAREYVSSAFSLLLLISIVLGLAATIAYPFMPWQRMFNVSSASIAQEGAKAFAVLFGWFLANIPLGIVTRVQSGLQKGYSSQILAACGNLVSLMGVLVAIHFKANLPWLVFASTAGTIVAILLNAVILFRSHPWLLPWFKHARWKSAAKILKLGLLFFVLQAGVAIGYSSDNIVITQVLGAGAVVAYSVPQKLFGYATMILMFGLTPLWPAYGEAISRGDIVWVKGTLRRSIYVSTGVAAFLGFALVLAAPTILRHWVGASFRVHWSLLCLLAVWGVIVAGSSSVSMFMNAAGGKTLRIQALLAALMAIINISLSVALTHRMGINGVVIGSITSQILTVVPLLIMLPRFVRQIENSGGSLPTLTADAVAGN